MGKAQAVGLAAELAERYGREKVDVQLLPGSVGAFEVTIDGERIHSKRKTGGFPRYGDVPMAIDMRLSTQ
jgi:selT/selW/selH-like putative selenoprotein